MKKFSTLLFMVVIFAVIVSPLFARGSSQSAGSSAATGPTKITWMSWGHAAPQEIRNDALKAMGLSDKYVIEPVVGGSNVPEVVEKIRLAFASRTNMPDIFQTLSTYYPEMAATGMLADVTSVFDRYNSQLIDGMRGLCTYNNRQYSFPYCQNSLVFIYRKDLFTTAGIDPASIRNTDSFIEAGRKLAAAVPGAYINAGNTSSFVDRFWWLAPGAGIRSLHDSNGVYNFNRDQRVALLLQDLKRIMDSGVTYNVPEWTPDWEQGFANSRIGAYLTCNWFKEFAATYGPDTKGKWGAMQYPEIGGSRGGSEGGGAVIMVLKDSPNRDAAIDMLTQLTFTKEGGLAGYTASGGGLVPVIREAYNDPMVAAGDAFWGNEFWKAELESYNRFITWDFNTAAGLESSILNPYLESYFTGRMGLQEALDAAARDMTAQIGNPLRM